MVVVVVFIHNVPVRFVNQLKLKGLSRSHAVHMATAAVCQQEHMSVQRLRLAVAKPGSNSIHGVAAAARSWWLRQLSASAACPWQMPEQLSGAHLLTGRGDTGTVPSGAVASKLARHWGWHGDCRRGWRPRSRWPPTLTSCGELN